MDQKLKDKLKDLIPAGVNVATETDAATIHGVEGLLRKVDMAEMRPLSRDGLASAGVLEQVQMRMKETMLRTLLRRWLPMTQLPRSGFRRRYLIPGRAAAQIRGAQTPGRCHLCA